jgi:hypothetical protein
MLCGRKLLSGSGRIVTTTTRSFSGGDPARALAGQMPRSSTMIRPSPSIALPPKVLLVCAQQIADSGRYGGCPFGQESVGPGCETRQSETCEADRKPTWCRIVRFCVGFRRTTIAHVFPLPLLTISESYSAWGCFFCRLAAWPAAFLLRQVVGPKLVQVSFTCPLFGSGLNPLTGRSRLPA